MAVSRHGRAPRRSAVPREGGGSDALDLATVLKASQAIAGEIVLERLLVKLMDIIMENAGAESVVLVLESDGEFLVQGIKRRAGPGARDDGGAAAPVRRRVEGHRQLRAAHVGARGARRILRCAASSATIRTCVNRRPKSVLCAPVAHKGKLIGVIYLENNQVAGAFTPDRLEALNILMSQIAVSIENATLYSQAGAADARDRGRERHADEGDRASASAPRPSSAATGITWKSSSRSAPASSRTRKAGSSTCRGAPAWPKSPRACCTTSAT